MCFISEISKHGIWKLVFDVEKVSKARKKTRPMWWRLTLSDLFLLFIALLSKRLKYTQKDSEVVLFTSPSRKLQHFSVD